MTTFGLKMIKKIGVEKNILKFYKPFSGQIFLHWAVATLKELVEFKKKILDHFSASFLSRKWQFQELRF